jgi:hypothetical protein
MNAATIQALADAAVSYAEQGYRVFPCKPLDKRPAVDKWEQRATCNPAHVRDAWANRHRGANIGLACGPSRLVVVDLDTHGTLPADWSEIEGLHDGRDVLTQLCEWAGQPWPDTRCTLTPSGGWHLWFRAPDDAELRNTAGRLGPMVDTRAAGGYIVVPPSIVGGQPYQWVSDRAPIELPGWLQRALTPAPRPAARPAQRGGQPTGPNEARLRGIVEHVRGGQPGDRNARTYWAACRLGEMVMAGEADQADAESLVQAALDAGLRGGETEARQTVRSGFQRGAGEPL